MSLNEERPPRLERGPQDGVVLNPAKKVFVRLILVVVCFGGLGGVFYLEKSGAGLGLLSVVIILLLVIIIGLDVYLCGRW